MKHINEGGGGGAGALVHFYNIILPPSTVCAVTVGDGGLGSTGQGSNGGASSFWNLAVAQGGGGRVTSIESPPFVSLLFLIQGEVLIMA